jgi:hypothetical protein
MLNMKLIIYFTILLIFLSEQLYSQDDKCNCIKNLDSLIAKTEKNYAGFPVKISKATVVNYHQLISSLRKQIAHENNPKKCFYFLKSYVRFFQDKHFILSYSNPNDYDKEIINYADNYFKTKIAKKELAKIEGIWINADTSLKLAIQQFPNGVFKGIVLASKDSTIAKGLVYVTFYTTKSGFIAKEFNSFITTDIPARQKGNLLQIWNHSMFGKVFPDDMTALEKKELNTWRNSNNGLSFQKLSPKTAYLKIPTFFNNDDKIQKLVSESDSTIKTCEYLIVDLTGNGGGNTGWVYLLPYFMTNSIVQYDTYLRVTPQNVKFKLTDLEPFVNNPIPDEYKKYFPNEILSAYKKAYTELPATTKSFYPIPGVTFPLDSILAKPKKIALVIDDLCGSSTEYFFFLAKQSKKTVTYGINTIGMMDYEGMSNATALPYHKYILTIPIVKSNWTDTNPIDKTGFQPNILLNGIKQEKWVDFILKDMERK